MKKVLYLIDTLEVGGAETSILEIASRLKNWVPVVVCFYTGESLKPRYEKAGIRVYSLNIKAKYGFLQGKRKLQKILEIENPDLVHATLFRAEFISRITVPKYKIPLINSFVNDSYAKERYELMNFRQRFILNLYKNVDRRTAKKVSKFMSITKAIVLNNSKALEIDADKVKIIYRGRNIEAFKNKINLNEIEKLKITYGNNPVILTVSRLLIRKGYSEALHAIKIVIKNYPNLKYLIAGEGHDRSKFEDLIKKLNLENNVFLLGNRNDIPTLLHFSNIFLFPSHYEGQGGALVEAMILGKPIIASKIPVIMESVQDHVSALLYEPKNIKDLSEKIIFGLETPLFMDKIGEGAKQQAALRFEIDNVSMQHETMYDEVLESY
tara:strand:- start:2469 stop:3611 length:1143 start_codon:yes stop_codon:yes gene_type:complete